MRVDKCPTVLLFLLLCAALTLGCNASREGGVSLAVDRECAVGIAQREASRRGWAETEIESAVLSGDHWHIVLWRLPKTPGGFAAVNVSSSGVVLSFEPGE